FTNWDDQFLVTQNPLIRSFAVSNLVGMFTSFFVNHYHPLVMVSYATEYAFAGLQPSLYHLTNIALHAANAMLVIILLQMLGGDKMISFIGGLMFALHPLRVESVAWIAERKDVLSAFFILAALIMYIRSRKSLSPSTLVPVLLFMVAALLSKAIAVVLPVLFLLYDYYADGKITKQAVMEKIPFFILSMIFGIIAVFAQYSTGARATDPHFHLLQSFFRSFYGMVFYAEKMLLPLNLTPVYPYPEMIHASYPILFWISPVMVAAIGFCMYRFRANRLLLFAVLFALVTLLPVLQFVPVGRAIAADRFTYLPSIGYSLLMGMSIRYVWKRFRQAWGRIMVVVVSISVLAIFFVMTQNQLMVWQNNITLWSRVLYYYPNYAEAYNDRGTAFAEQGMVVRALMDLDTAIHFDSTDSEYFVNRGLVYVHSKQYPEAVKDFSSAIKFDPQDLAAYFLRGEASRNLHAYSSAIADYSHILDRQPLVYQVRINRANTFIDSGDLQSAYNDLVFVRRMNVEIDSTLWKRVTSMAAASQK
ncbi:MAG TPA: tetratricopeptide repeat protein, partial [Bacteroidota bacterium]|nr:tetratricopeptide repeat protein [Bacteroidota bacterium]